MFEFSIQATSGRARIATFNTPRGCVTTPMFMPVGTQGTVKGIEARELIEIGSQIILSNTYHLLLRPGPELVHRHGQLPGFTGYPGPFLTDSGGFQVMSLGNLSTISEHGVMFKNHLNGDPLEMTPESSIQAQELIGADIIMAFDECPPYPATHDYGQRSLERTARWLERCLNAKTRTDQALFAIVQGGVDQVLRQNSLDATLPFQTPGFALGGLAVGEPKIEMYPTIHFTTRQLPSHKPRYLMGVGHPEDLVASIGLGVDMFDCVYPTRTGRFGYALTANGRINLSNASMREDLRALEADCDCYACQTHSRAYISHLFKANEMLGPKLLSLHNLRHLHRLVEAARDAITENRYAEWARQWGMQAFQGTLPSWFAQAIDQNEA